MDLGEILTRSWKIVWKFKILWIFGIFAACGTSRGGSFGGGGSGYRTGPGPTTNLPPPVLPPGLEDKLLNFLNFIVNPAVYAGFITGIISLLCVIFLLTIFLSTMGRVGLIRGAVDADAGAEHLNFVDLWKSGLRYFWRFFGLTLLIGSPALLIFLALGVGALLVLLSSRFSSGGYQLGAALPAFVAFIPVLFILLCVIFLLGVFISFLGPQAERAIVIENEGVISGIRRGWEVLTKNLGSIVVIWLIVVVIGFVVGVLISVPLLIVVIPLFVTYIFSRSDALLITIGIFLLVYILLSWVVNGILTSYLESVWTLTYLRLTQPKPDAPSPIAVPNA